MFMSADDYRESLRSHRPVVLDGRRVDSVPDEPAFAPGIRALG
jgi:4-hydroxybutyryl-CoA dehydratase/vinylacetyl-CoA-Delta-isomerase